MRALGRGPGPAIGRLLEQIRERQESGELRSRKQALAYLKRIT
jgi:hypothetical protein